MPLHAVTKLQEKKIQTCCEAYCQKRGFNTKKPINIIKFIMSKRKNTTYIKLTGLCSQNDDVYNLLKDNS